MTSPDTRVTLPSSLPPHLPSFLHPFIPFFPIYVGVHFKSIYNVQLSIYNFPIGITCTLEKIQRLRDITVKF